MCGRYYVDDDTAREIEKLVRQVDEKMHETFASCRVEVTAKDIHPTETAPILASSGSGLECRWQRWGFPGFQKGRVIFNARCESAMEKPMFREAVLHHRAVIPAAWFYEWDGNKQKHTFYRKDRDALFMAGCYRKYEDGDRFVILTTQANASMEPVHVFSCKYISLFLSWAFPVISAVYSCINAVYQYIIGNSRTHSRRYRGYNP